MDLDRTISPPYPAFYTRRDPSGAEFVLLDTGDAPDSSPLSRIVEDRTGYEALLNHVYLFSGPIPPQRMAKAQTMALTAARNLRDTLGRTFPGKRFAVFLTLNSEDGILRFHQLWPGEAPYYEVHGSVERDADGMHTDIYAFYTGDAE